MRSYSFLFITFFIPVFLLFNACQTTAPESNSDSTEVILDSTEDIVTDEPTMSEKLDFYKSSDDAGEALEILGNSNTEMTIEEAKIYLALLLADERLEEATDFADQWMEKQPEDRDFIYFRALIAVQLQDDNKGEALIQKGLLLNADDPGLNLLKASMEIDGKHYSEANQSLAVTLKQEPDNFQALILKSDVLMHLGKGNDELNEKFLREAVKVLNRIEQLEPTYTYTYIDRARALTVLGETLSAYDDLTRAIELEPDVEWHYVDRARLTLKYRNNRLAALEDLKKATEINPDNFLANVFMAGIYFDELDFDKSLEHYTKVLQLRPEYFYAYESVGVLYYQKGMYTESINAFLKAYDEFNDDEGYLLMAGLAMMQKGEVQKAKQLLTESARKVDRNSLVYEIYRFYLEGGSDYFVQAKIRQETDESVKRKYYYYLGMYYLYLKSPASAQMCFQEASNLTYGFEASSSKWYLNNIEE